MYVAHIRHSDDEIQSVQTHLQECMKLAEKFGEPLGLKHLFGIAALLHDFGKYSDAFKDYLHAAVYDLENAPKRGSVDHSTAGGKLIFERYHKNSKNPFQMMTAEIIGNAIISHHASLHDFISENLESPFIKRVKEKPIEDFLLIQERFFHEVMPSDQLDEYFEVAVNEVRRVISEVDKDQVPRQLYFLSRLVFSALVDADRTNTRLFEDAMDEQVRDETLLEQYLAKLEEYLRRLRQKSADSHINRLRQEMSDRCYEVASQPSNIYTLSIPTGGGKTLASLRYALHHSLIHHKKRIIYIVPFTTIIEQNAAEVSRILEDDENIIEHHSNVVDVSGDDEFQEGTYSTLEKVKLARDTWDAPIIFTTMVQFLEACYGHGSSSVRRLHNLCEAVLIFDEVQKVPTKSIVLFNQAVNFLKSSGCSTSVLCTATQPALEFVEKHLETHDNKEMMTNLEQIEEAFRRIQLLDHTQSGPLSTDALCKLTFQWQELEKNVLVVLNTKSTVKKLYLAMVQSRPDLPIYHLSTSMCAKHRQTVLKEIREALDHDRPFICVTTQLIEAGVDVDFNCVIRSLAGLDSIAQAAGRCNRHGKKDVKTVLVIEHAEEVVSKLDDIARGREITKRMMRAFLQNQQLYGGNLLSHQAMTQYFKEFYTIQSSKLTYPLDNLGTSITEILFSSPVKHPFVQQLKHQSGKRLDTILPISFRLASQKYQVIESNTRSVVVPYDEQAKEIIADLASDRNVKELGSLFKKAQSYTVNLFEWELNKLTKQGMVYPYLDGLLLAVNESVYSKEFGLDILGENLKNEAYMF